MAPPLDGNFKSFKAYSVAPGSKSRNQHPRIKFDFMRGTCPKCGRPADAFMANNDQCMDCTSLSR